MDDSLNKSFIKIEVEEDLTNEDEMKNASIIQESKSPRISSRRCGFSNDSSNIYAKPRIHFTGRGIVTKSQPGDSITLNKKRSRKPKIEIIEDGSQPEIKQEISVNVEVTNDEDSESYFYIKKKRDRRVKEIPNVFLDKCLEENNFKDSDEKEHTELRIVDDDVSPDTDNIAGRKSSNSPRFSIAKMFRKVADSDLFECTLCFKQMKEVSTRQHCKTHSGVKPFACSFCNSRFTRRSDVKRHLNMFHCSTTPPVTEEFTCVVCSRSFTNSRSLMSHLRVHTSGPASLMCAVCGFKFGKREYFLDHIRLLHPPLDEKRIRVGEEQLRMLMANRSNDMTSKKRAKDVFDQSDNLAEEEELDFGSDSPAKVEVMEIEVEGTEDLDQAEDEDTINENEDTINENEDTINENEDTINENEDTIDENDSLDVNMDDAHPSFYFVERGTLHLTQTLKTPYHEKIPGDEEAVDRAIQAAVTQSHSALRTLYSTLGMNLASNNGTDIDDPSEIIDVVSDQDHMTNICVDDTLQVIDQTNLNSLDSQRFEVQLADGKETSWKGASDEMELVLMCSDKNDLEPVDVIMHQSL